jgi:hypothetical protein
VKLAGRNKEEAITADFDKRHTALQQECHAREEALFAKFHEALKTVAG